MSKTSRFEVTVNISTTTANDWWTYDIHVNRKRLIMGDRSTRAQARRAARAQLTQLRTEVDQALANLK